MTKVIAGEQVEKAVFLQHTRDHKDCPACTSSNQMLTIADIDLSVLKFSQVIPLWKALRKQQTRLKGRTHEATDEYLKQLEVFFGPMRLCDIGPGNVREYQIARGTNHLVVEEEVTHPWKHAAGNSYINHELSVLQQIMKHCKLWERIHLYYSPLRVPKWSPREDKLLSEEDEEHLFKVCNGDPEVELAYWVACITNNTSAAGSELRGLRLKNLYLREPVFDRDGKNINPSEIYIPADAVKNESRPRKIALNLTAEWAVKQCLKRALNLGSCIPDHFLFPFRVKRNKYDPERRPSRWWLRNSWNKLRDKTGFNELCPHDLRHLFITRMLENGVDPETVRAIAGHVTEEMTQYYSHHRRQAKYEAVMAVEPSLANKKPGAVRMLPRRTLLRSGS